MVESTRTGSVAQAVWTPCRDDLARPRWRKESASIADARPRQESTGPAFDAPEHPDQSICVKPHRPKGVGDLIHWAVNRQHPYLTAIDVVPWRIYVGGIHACFHSDLGPRSDPKISLSGSVPTLLHRDNLPPRKLYPTVCA